MVDFTTYQTPGLYTEAVPGEQLSVQFNAPNSIGLFGLSVGYREHVETVGFNPDILDDEGNTFLPAPTRELAHPGVLLSSIKAINPFSGETYEMGTDFVVEKKDTQGTTNTRDDTYLLKRVFEGRIEPGDIVEVSYRFTDHTYYEPKLFFDFDDVRDHYGPSFDSNGNIVSEITLAASLAFTNGASRMTICAVEVQGDVPSISDYEDALSKLKDQSDVSIIITTSGMEQIQTAVLSHVRQQSATGYERRAILGRDGSVDNVASSQLIANAQSMNDRRVALVSPARLRYYVTSANKEVTIGGQYLAAAVAGVSASQIASIPLTRKQVLGFVDIVDNFNDATKNMLSSSGVMVVEKTRRSRFQVRHGVTTKPVAYLDREWSVTGQEDAMIFRLRDFLDNGDLIGNIIDDITLVSIKASADAALQALVASRIINAYQNLKVRQVLDTPDVVEVRFEWKPAMPLNYIIVKYSVNMSTGDSQMQLA